LLVATVWAAPRSARAAQPSIHFAPAGAWIRPTELSDGRGPDGGRGAGGARVRLFDRQVRVDAHGQELYWRIAKQAVNEATLEVASQIEIEFDPSYERLTVHSVTVRRGNEAIDRLDKSAFHLAEREKRLDAQIYDGRLSAVLFVSDVRVGDVVEYSYTLAGADPTAGERYMDALVLGLSFPIEHLHARVVVPDGRRVRFRPRGPGVRDGSLGPTIHEVPGATEYEWDLRDTPAYQLDPDAPGSFEPAPWVQVTEYGTWAEVARIGARLFDVGPVHERALDEWVKTARSNAGGGAGDAPLQGQALDDFILRAARFVQDEVRYVALEVGMSRRRPTDPAVVLARRYGDCKDKTALLVALLRAAGIRATPALISTSGGEHLDELEPTLGAFDHVIARVVGSSGEALWIDSTVPLQGGGLDRLRYSPFERALVFDPATAGLSSMAREPAAAPSPYVRDFFRVAMPGTTTPTEIDSERQYRGPIADTMRALIHAYGRDELRKSLVKKYQVDYPSARDDGELKVVDDRNGDVVTLTIHLIVPDFWSTHEKDKPQIAPITAHLLEDGMPRPSAGERRAPLALPFPSHARYEVAATLPFDLPVDPTTFAPDIPGLRFQFQSSGAERQLSYVFDVESTQPEIPVEQLADYLAAVDVGRASLARNLRYLAPEPDRPNWWLAAPLGLATLLSLWGGRRLYSYNPPPKQRAQPDPRYVGLRGWLILLGFGLCAGPLRLGHALLKILGTIGSHRSWMYLTTSGQGGYSPFKAGMFLADVVLGIPLLAYAATLVVIFFRKRRSFRLHYVYLALAMAVFGTADEIAFGTAHIHEFEASLAGIGIWIMYLTSSRRVAGTFVE
jgi:hypothetical protein